MQNNTTAHCMQMDSPPQAGSMQSMVSGQSPGIIWKQGTKTMKRKWIIAYNKHKKDVQPLKSRAERLMCPTDKGDRKSDRQ